MNNAEIGLKRLTVEAPLELHRKFKTIVSGQGVSIKDVILSLIESYVRKSEAIEGDKKKTSNPGNQMKELEALVDGIVEARMAQESIKTKEAEKAKEAPEIHTVEKPAEKPAEKPVEDFPIHTTKKPDKKLAKKPPEVEILEVEPPEEKPVEKDLENPKKERRKINLMPPFSPFDRRKCE